MRAADAKLPVGQRRHRVRLGRLDRSQARDNRRSGLRGGGKARHADHPRQGDAKRWRQHFEVRAGDRRGRPHFRHPERQIFEIAILYVRAVRDLAQQPKG
jgi:hypothetical protein